MSIVSSLVEYWPLNEASGDALGAHASKTMTDQNTVTSDTGHVYPLARKFTYANGEWFVRAAEADLNPTGDWSAWWWCNLASQGPGSADYRYVFGASAAYPGGIEAKFAYNDRLAIGVKQDGLWDYIHTDHNGDAIGAWTFWACWYDSAAETLYGRFNNTGPTDSGAADLPNAYSVEWRIGGRGPGTTDTFDGLLGPLALHNEVLSAADFTTIYNGGAGLTYEELLATAGTAGYNKVDLSLGIRL